MQAEVAALLGTLDGNDALLSWLLAIDLAALWQGMYLMRGMNLRVTALLLSPRGAGLQLFGPVDYGPASMPNLHFFDIVFGVES